jgi:hypothetical protein
MGWLSRWFGGAGSLPLPEIVTRLADRQSDKLRLAFYRSMLSSRVGSRVQNPDPYRASGQFVTGPDDGFGVPFGTTPGVGNALAVYCNIPAMVAAHPNDAWFEMDARVVLEMAAAKGCAVVVINGLDGRDSWAAISREDVPRILAGEFG